MKFHIAQVNIGRMKAPLDSPVMAGFVARLDEINALADRSDGFVWRLQTEAGNATYLRPYDDDRILFNMSVWESVEALKDYVYRTAHAELLRDRNQWFEEFEAAYLALWWVPAGHTPSIDEAKKRLAYLEAHGPSQFAFTFRSIHQPDEAFLSSFDWATFLPCPNAV
ncbi:MAG TPA: DUF3291 domain-containing protein [Thermoanaerobaculia bacterium]|jgi:hypothetical protein|nr:DUF3291 domain-containing protein [Thermoanaerobaculia bacterium]